MSDSRTITKRPDTYNNIPCRQENIRLRNLEHHVPITGFLGSVFTSATGLYTQLIPVILISFAVAAATFSASSAEPVAAIAMAPGLCNMSIHINADWSNQY